jgi:thioredoxin-dependent peroxiredoxin
MDMPKYFPRREDIDMTSQATALKVGDRAPDFSLPSHPAGTISLQDFSGKKNVILAFYPKDDTPGCTKEMCAFSTDLDQFNNADTQVLGISCDDATSHGAFAAKHSLKLPLLADVGGKVGKQYGTIGADKSNADRTLFIIDKNGIIRHIHHGMPSNEEMLKIVKGL